VETCSQKGGHAERYLKTNVSTWGEIQGRLGRETVKSLFKTWICNRKRGGPHPIESRDRAREARPRAGLKPISVSTQANKKETLRKGQFVAQALTFSAEKDMTRSDGNRVVKRGEKWARSGEEEGGKYVTTGAVRRQEGEGETMGDKTFGGEKNLVEKMKLRGAKVEAESMLNLQET